MRLDRRPLLDTRGDASLYVERPEDGRVARSLEAGLSVLVHGTHGSGRTSLLRHVQWLARQRDASSAASSLHRVSAGGVATPDELLTRLLTVVVGPGNAGESDTLDLVEMLRAAVEERGARRTFLVDDVNPTLGRALFGALRDEVWTVNASWLVTCLTSDVNSLLLPPVDSFFEVVLPLSGMSVAAGSDLVLRRLEDVEVRSFDRESGFVLAELAGGNPRRLVDLVREVVVDEMTVDALRARDERVEHLRRAVSPGARALAEEVDAWGPTGPSDATLQARFGLSRPRLAALFRELVEGGLVEEVVATSSGPGRPRLVYQPVRPADQPTSTDVGSVR